MTDLRQIAIEVLWDENPVGIPEEERPNAADEYDGLAGTVVEWVTTYPGADPPELAQRLNRILVDDWGLQNANETAMAIVERIWVAAQYGR